MIIVIIYYSNFGGGRRGSKWFSLHFSFSIHETGNIKKRDPFQDKFDLIFIQILFACDKYLKSYQKGGQGGLPAAVDHSKQRKSFVLTASKSFFIYHSDPPEKWHLWYSKCISSLSFQSRTHRQK